MNQTTKERINTVANSYILIDLKDYTGNTT